MIVTRSQIPELADLDFAAGCAILVDKPIEWTSFNVVSKIRYLIRHHLGVKKFKVGHAGTLDPLATGLLIICTGKMTKSITDFIQFRFGSLTNCKHFSIRMFLVNRDKFCAET